MTREVTHEAEGPDIVNTEDHGGEIHICQCGLSDNKPFCDGSHAVTSDEDDGARYKYEDDDDEKKRHKVEKMIFEE